MQTDHVPLRHLPNQASVNSRIWKWINILQGYDLELHHILGKKNPAGSLQHQHFAKAYTQQLEVKEEKERLGECVANRGVRRPKIQEWERPRTCTQGSTLTCSWANQSITLKY